MPLFRFHRGGLEESLKTTVIVKDKIELMSHILNNSSLLKLNPSEGDEISVDVKIDPYWDQENNFDPRIGWYTHIVLFKVGENPYFPAGFLSEPLE